MKIIISALHFEWTDIDNCFDRVANEFGLDGMELSLKKGVVEHPDCTNQDLDRISELKEKFGLAVSGHIWEDLAVLGLKHGPNRMLYWLDVCKKAGIEQLVVHGGTFAKQKEGVQITKRILQKIIPDYEKAQLVINLENHYDYNYKNCQELFSQPWEFLEIFHTIHSPSLRFCFDTGHANMTRNSEALLTELGSYLQYVHIADNHGVDDDHCPYKYGTVQWEKVLKLLHQVNFDGIFCMEFPVGTDTEPLTQCIKDIKNLWTK